MTAAEGTNRGGYANVQGRLYVMVGPPFSGKSWWVRHRFESTFGVRPAIVVPDLLRTLILGNTGYSEVDELVWANVHVTIKGLLAAGNHVVLDACNLRDHQRRKWARYDPVFVEMLTPLAVALERARACGMVDAEGFIRRGYDQWDKAKVQASRQRMMYYGITPESASGSASVAAGHGVDAGPDVSDHGQGAGVR